MTINVSDKDIFILSLEYDISTSLFWEYFSDLVCENIDIGDLEQCIENFRKELLINEKRN